MEIRFFEGTERLFGDVCHIISLWPKVPLQRDESIIGCHLVLAVDEVSLMNHHWVNLQAAAAARASVILSIFGIQIKNTI